MTPIEFRHQYSNELRAFLETEAGTHFRIVLSQMRGAGAVQPLAGVDYNQLLAAEHKLREGYEQAVINLNTLATRPEAPEKVRQPKYHKPTRKK